MDLSLPFHNYLGPGNQVPNGPPQSQVDSIAQLHDVRYSIAEEAQQVFGADQEAIGDFLSLVGTDPFAAIGALGLSAKTYFEKKYGLVYPKMPAIPDAVPIPGPSAAKRPADSMAEYSPEEGSSIAGGTGASVLPGCKIRGPSSSNASRIVYKKAFQIYSGGYQFQHIDTAALNGAFTRALFTPGVTATETPLNVIDPNQLPWYMSQTEYKLLPIGAYATQIKIKVTPLGYRLPFATNDAASGYANAQTLVQIAHGVGLEHSFPVAMMSYTAADTDLTKVTGITDPFVSHDRLHTMLYGTGANAAIPAAYGVPRHNNSYAVVISPDKDEKILLDQFYTIQNINDIKGTPIINYSYETKNGILSRPYNWLRACLQDKALVENGFQGSKVVAEQSKTQQPEPPEYVTNAGPFKYNDLFSIEQSDLYQTHVGMEQSAVQPPRIYFGCMPVQSNAPLSSTAAFSPAVVQWYIETEMHVTIPMQPITQNQYGYFPLTAWDPVKFNDAGFEYMHALRWHGKGMQFKPDPSPTVAMVTDQEEDDTRSDTLSRISSIRRRMERTI